MWVSAISFMKVYGLSIKIWSNSIGFRLYFNSQCVVLYGYVEFYKVLIIFEWLMHDFIWFCRLLKDSIRFLLDYYGFLIQI